VSEFFRFALPGLPFGCSIGLIAVGLVLTYRATGVFNFAFGAQAYASAYVYTLCIRHGLGRLAALVLAVVVLQSVLGFGFERLLFSRIATWNVTGRIVSAIALLVLVPSLIAVIFGEAPLFAPPALLLDGARVYFHVGSTPINGVELATVGVTGLIVAAVIVVQSKTTAGLAVRAAVDSRRLLDLLGVPSGRVVSGAWIISSALAGLAGVLLAPQYPTVQSETYAVLLVAGIAAGALGSFSNIPLALCGGLVLGVAESLGSGYLPTDSVWHRGLLPALPFVVLAILLVTLPGMRRLEHDADPLASVEPPPPAPPASARRGAGGMLGSVAPWALVGVFVLSVLTWVPDNWVFILTTGIALSTIFLSITVITGIAGQVSLCQAAFAGVGAFTAGQLAVHFGVPVIDGGLLGGLLAGAAGGLAALPALRLRGLALALLTLALALFCDAVVFPTSWAGGPSGGLGVPRPIVGPLDFATPSTRTYFGLAVVVLAVAGVVVAAVRRGTTGLYLEAMRSSPRGAESVGVDLSRMKVLAFVLAAVLAGVGGAVYGSLEQVATPAAFATEFSLVFVVIVAAAGLASVPGAIAAGIGYVVLQQLFSYLPGRLGAGSLATVVFAVGALGYAAHPEGVLVYAAHRVQAAAGARLGAGAAGDAEGAGSR
jgi:branched-chain amino acid transport system permease protein